MLITILYVKSHYKIVFLYFNLIVESLTGHIYILGIVRENIVVFKFVI